MPSASEAPKPPSVDVVVSFVLDKSYYPRGGPERRRQLTYWRNIAVNAATLRHVAPRDTVRFRVATNSEPPPRVARVLEDNGATLFHPPFDHEPPRDLYGKFAGSLYVLDTMAWYASNVTDDRIVLFVDPDIVWLRDPTSVAARVHGTDGVMAYDVGYAPDYPCHGLTRRDLAAICRELDPARPIPNDPPPPYFGGEFYGVDARRVPSLAEAASRVWAAALDRHRRGLTTFRTEEHVLSAVLWWDGVAAGVANEFIRRIWTLPAPFGDRDPARDHALVAWHLPVEKTVGLPAVARHLERGRALPEDVVPWLARRLGLHSHPGRWPREAALKTKWALDGTARSSPGVRT